MVLSKHNQKGLSGVGMDDTKRIFHKKLKTHAKKVGQHVKKHHKKYLGGFFAGFAIVKTAKVAATVVGLIAGSVFITTHSPLHEVVGKDIDYSTCVFEEQFCFDLAVKNERKDKQLSVCMASGAEMINKYQNKIIDEKEFTLWVDSNFGIDIATFQEPYMIYNKQGFICECCKDGALGEGCCKAKTEYCMKSYDGKYAEACTTLSKQCETQVCGESYDNCVFEEQFCIDLAAKNERKDKQLSVCMASGAEMINKYQNKIIDEKEFTLWVDSNFGIDIATFQEPYMIYNKQGFICECCKDGALGEGCCKVKYEYCMKSNDGKYTEACTLLNKQCETQVCGESYDNCVFEEQFCIDLARNNKWDEKQVNVCIASGEEIVGYINKGTNNKLVSKFLENLGWKGDQKEFAEPYNVYQKEGAICSCCNGESGQESCCNAKEKNCTASTSNTKGDDYCEQCSQLKSAHSRGPGGGEDCTFDAQFCIGWYNNLKDMGYGDYELGEFWDDCVSHASQILSDYLANDVSYVEHAVYGYVYGDVLAGFEFDSAKMEEYFSKQVSCDCCDGGEPDLECCDSKYSSCVANFPDNVESCTILYDDCKVNACESSYDGCMYEAQFCVSWYHELKLNGFEDLDKFWDDCLLYSSQILQDYGDDGINRVIDYIGNKDYGDTIAETLSFYDFSELESILRSIVIQEGCECCTGGAIDEDCCTSKYNICVSQNPEEAELCAKLGEICQTSVCQNLSSCSTGWYQGKYLNNDFWTQWYANEKSTAFLANALFGNNSAYTVGWDDPLGCYDTGQPWSLVEVSSWSDILSHSISTGGVRRLNDNTIYVLQTKSLGLGVPLDMGTCSALVSAVETQIYSTWRLPSGFDIYFGKTDASDFSIIDNIGLSAFTGNYSSEYQGYGGIGLTNSIYDVINDVQVWGFQDWGIVLGYTDTTPVYNTLLNNIQSFGNGGGIKTRFANYFSLNNVQTYKNQTHGIAIWRAISFSGIVNNVQSYTNGVDGFSINLGGDTLILNNVMSYMNGGYGFQGGNGGYFNGTIISDCNMAGDDYYDMSTSVVGGFRDIGLRTGNYIRSNICYGYDYITNPLRSPSGKNDDDNYLYRWNNYKPINQIGIYTVGTGTVWSEKWGKIAGYSYGVNIKTQDNPIVYDGNYINNPIYVNTYNPCQYIGSTVTKITDGTNSLSGSLVVGSFYPFTVSSSELGNLVSGNPIFEIYGTVSSFAPIPLGSSSIAITNIIYRVITQLFGSNWNHDYINDYEYFATHFESYGTGELPPEKKCMTGRDNDNFIDSTFWSMWANNPDKSGSLICALYGDAEDYHTAYTQYWSGWDYTQCSGMDMDVQIVSTLPGTISSNTIYVVSGMLDLPSGYINMGNCNAIVGKNSDPYQNYSCGEIASNYTVSISNKSIIDSLSFMGGWCSSNSGAIRYGNNITLHNIYINDYKTGMYNLGSQNFSVYMDDITMYFNDVGLLGSTVNNSVFNNIISYGVSYGLSPNLYGTGISFSGNNNIFNNIEIYRHDIGISFSGNNNIFNNIKSYDNQKTGFFLKGNNNVMNTGLFHDNNVNLMVNKGNNNEFNNIEIYDNWEKNVVYNGACGANQNKGLDIIDSSYNKFKDLIIYNFGYGLRMDNGNYNFINNSQIYGSCEPLSLKNSNRNAFNNMQIYGLNEPVSVGVNIYALEFNNSNYNIINNSLLFLPYVYLSGNYNRFVNTTILENSNCATLSDSCSYFCTGAGTNYYNGTLKIFNNYKCMLSLLSQGGVVSVTSSTPNLLLSAGSVNTGIKWSFDYMTNAIDGSGRYLTDWYDLNSNSSFKGPALGYSFGSGVPVQSLPLYYSGTTLYGSGVYDTSKYIGSKVARQTATMTVNPTTTTGDTVVKVTSTTTTINKYSIFNNGFFTLAATGRNRGVNTTITLTGTPGEKVIIGQIWSTNGYFATHFQKTGILEQAGNQGNGSRNCRGWDNDKFLDKNFWLSWAGNNTTGKNQIKCALYGIGPNDTTAYTKYWSGWTWGSTTNGCDVENLVVSVVTSLPSNGNLAANTIYVLNTSRYTGTNNISLPKCTSIIGKNTNTNVLPSLTEYKYIQSSGSVGPAYSILDNLILEGYTLNFTNVKSSTFHKLKIKRHKNIGIGGLYGIVRGGNDTTSTNNVFHTIEIINYAGGLYLNRGASSSYHPTYDIYSNIDIYGANTGIDLTNTRFNLFNNIHVHDNKEDGIRINNNVSYNTFNNIHTHGNTCGIIGSGISYSTDNVFNNVQTYNNKQIGITLHGLTNSILNNISSYNNPVAGIYSDSITNGYFGDNYITNIGLDAYTGIAQGNPNSFFSGGIITGFTLSWDYITNSKLETGYVLEWTGNFDTLPYKYKTDGSSTYKTGYSYLYDDHQEILGYSYGVQIKTQTKPIRRINTNTLSWFDDANYYDVSNYIGSDVKKIPGSAAISCVDNRGIYVGYQNSIQSISLCSTSNYRLNDNMRLADKVTPGGGGGGGYEPPVINVDYLCTITGYSTQTGSTPKFSVYALFSSGFKSGEIIGHGTGITWSSNPGTNGFVTQIWGGTYFATHFQGENSNIRTLSCKPGWDNSKFLNSEFWNGWAGNTELGHEQIKCALYGAGTGANNLTAYTKGWSGWVWGNTTKGCNVLDMDVIVSNHLEMPLSPNTVYVLTGPTAINVETIEMNTCNAIVSISGTVFYTQNWLEDPMVTFSNVKFGILDNLSLDGLNNGAGGQHYGDCGGVSLSSSSNNTLNNFKVHNARCDDSTSNGIDMSNGNHNVLNNIQVYNQSYGIFMTTCTYNALNNIQTFNNVEAGVYLGGNSNNNILNNIESYNNIVHGIIFSSGIGNKINEVRVYNNGSNGIYSSSNQNYFYGTLASFGNTNNSISLTTGSTITNILWETGQVTSGVLGMDLMMNVKDGTGYMLSWSGNLNYASLRGNKSVGQVVEYSYGGEMKSQRPLVVFSGTSPIVFDAADSSKYIGGDTLRASGSGERGDCTSQGIYNNQQVFSCTYSGHSTSSFINQYKIYVGQAESQLRSLSQSATVTGAGINSMDYVTQLRGGENIIHFVSDGSLSDGEAPIVSLSVTTGEAQTTQTATLKCSDTGGVVAYYRGLTEPTSTGVITVTTNLSAITGANGLAQTISSAGTYWLACMDAAGNRDKTSIVIRSYKVQNMLDKITGATGTYTTTHYDEVGALQGTYLIPNGTILSMGSGGLYGEPLTGHNTYKGWKTSKTSSTTATISPNPTLTSSTVVTYYRWYWRDTHTLTLNNGTGITSVTGAGTYKYGKEVSIDATVSEGYTWSKWTIGTSNTQYSATKATTVILTGDITLKANATPDATCPSITAYSGVYDGVSHSIGVNGGEGGTIQYRTSTNGSWSTTNPSATNVSNTTVYVRVSGDSNHNTVDCGSTGLTITKKPVTVTASDQSKIYDGSALSADGTCSAPAGSLVNGHTLTCTSAGSQTTVGSSTKTLNTAKVMNGSTDVSSNYNITKANGTLTVTAREITVKAKDQSKIYDGTALTADTTCEVTVGSLVNGQTLSCTSAGSQTTVGSSTKTLNTAKVMNGTTDMSSNYSITKTNGTLTVNAADATCPTITAYSGTYDGNSHTITVGSAVGGTVQYRTSPSGNWSTTNPSATNVSTTTVYVRVSGDSNHNTVNCGSTGLTITKKPVTVTASDQSKIYDGSALSADGTCSVTVGALVTNHAVTCTNSGSQTNAGSSQKTLKTVVIKNGGIDVSSNYEVIKVNGTLTVNSGTISASASDKTAAYNGSAISPNTVTVTIPSNGSTVKYGTAVGTYNLNSPQTYIDVGTYTIYYQVTAPNYNTKTGSYTLTIIDNAPPVCEWQTPTNTCISGGIAGTIQLICTDDVGISQTSVSASNVTYNTTWLTLGNSNTVAGTSTSKTYTFTYIGRSGVNGTTGFTLKANAVKDTSNNGNEVTGPSTAIEVDNSAPSVPSMNQINPSCNSGTSITVSSTTVSDVGCADRVEYQFCMMSGVNSTTKCASNSSIWSDTASATFNNLSNGIRYYFFVRTRDGLGNTSAWSSSVSYTVDTTAPTTTATISPSNWSCTSGDVTVSFSAGTNGCNSDNTTYYCRGKNNCNPTTVGASATISASLGGVATGYVRFRSVDGLGNTETIQTTGMIYVDKAGPTGTISVANSCYTGTTIPLTLSASDVGCSTVSGMRFSCDGLTWVDLDQCGVAVSANNTKSSLAQMIVWYDKKEGKLYYYTDADKIYMNEDSAGMFAGRKFTTIDLTNFDTSKVVNMSNIFNGCEGLKTIYVGDGFTTQKVKESENMFMGATKLVGGAGTVYNKEHLDHKYAHIDGGTENPGYFTAGKASKLSKLSATLMTGGELNTLWDKILDGGKVGGFERSHTLPEKCNPKEWTTCGTKISDDKLSTTTVIAWYDKDKSKIYYYTDADDTYLNENSAQMFAGTTFVSIDLSEFDTRNVSDMTSMFEGCSNLTTIYAGDGFTTEKVKASTNMFLKSQSLVGGAGTVYNKGNVDHKYAHIDGGKENPGYFTAKANEEEKVVTMVSGKEFAQVLDKLLGTKADPQDLVFERSDTLPAGCDGGRVAYSTTTNLNLLNIGCDTSDGNKTIYVQYQDALGNTGPVSSTNFTLDMTAPYITSLTTNATCKTGGRAWTVTGIWNESVVGFTISDISVTNGTRGNSFISSSNPTYSWAVTSPSTGGTYGTSAVTLGTNIVTDSCGNPNNTSTGISWQYDNAGPTFTVNNVSVVECSTGTLTITGVTQVGCAAAHTSAYSRNGGSSYGSSSTFSQYKGTTGTETKTIRVRDKLLNYTETTAAITWTDAVLSINSTYNLGLITGATTINNLAGASVFNATGYGSCETVTITAGSCVNATMSLNGGNVTITPTANVSGTGSCTLRFTDGDTTHTGTINFTIQTLQPTVVFTGNVTNQVNPSGSCINRNRYLTKMQISNTPELGNFVYAFKETVNGSTSQKNYSVYDSGLVLMYNFDKVTSLGETNTVVKDLSNYGNTGTISSSSTVTWTSDGVWGGSYNFVGGNINAGNDESLRATTNFTVSTWIKTTMSPSGNTYFLDRYDTSGKRVWGLCITSAKTVKVYASTNGTSASYNGVSNTVITDGNWHLVTLVHNGSKLQLYIDGIKEKEISVSSLFNTDAQLTIGKTTTFRGQIDEVRMYNRVLTPDEIQFLYKSNLSKINTGQWLFQTLNTCLAQAGTYAYSGIVSSSYGYGQTIGRSISTCIPDVIITGGVDMHLGTGLVSDVDQEFSGQYNVNVQVEDWIGRNGWTGTVRITSQFSGQNINFTISSQNFEMKNSGAIQDLGHYLNGIIPERTTGLVQLSSALNNFSHIVTYLGNNQGTPYFVANYPGGDFMCNGGIYADKPYLKLNVPAWTPGDEYVAKIYWTIEP